MQKMPVFIYKNGIALTEQEVVNLAHWHMSNMLNFLLGIDEKIPPPPFYKDIEILSTIPSNFNIEDKQISVDLVVF